MNFTALSLRNRCAININNYLGGKKMKTKHKITILVVVVLVLGVWAIAADSGPRSSKQMLEEIYNAVVLTGQPQKEGYSQHYTVAEYSTETLFTVPAAKEFVLRKIYFEFVPLELQVDGVEFIQGYYFDTPANGAVSEDFPDKCIVVNSGETLTIVNNYQNALRATVIGYFCDAP